MTILQQQRGKDRPYMPALTMSETEDCQRRFQAAVDVIQSLPKNGSYRPSYEVMLRFYGLYKQAVCGPCTASRPGFWDPVGRYKWEAWNQLGDMSRESAMTAYVDAMKKVAQEVIDTMQINEKTASYFHYFEPLYHVIHDMPRPPETLLSLSSDIPAKEQMHGLDEHDLEKPTLELAPQQNTDTIPKSERQCESTDIPAKEQMHGLDEHDLERPTLELAPQQNTDTIPKSELQCESCTEPPVSEVQGPTSDSENEAFCDSLEQLDTVKLAAVPDGNTGFHNGHAPTDISGIQKHHYTPLSQKTQVGAGHGGEGAEDSHGPSMRRRTSGRQEAQQIGRDPTDHMAHRNARLVERLVSGSGSGRGGGDNFDGGPNRPQDDQVQQQIILALRQLREDMQSVMERLDVVEGLATANTQVSQWRSHLQLTATEAEDKWWPFEISGRTLLLLLVWPLVTQGLMFLLRWRKRKINGCI